MCRSAHLLAVAVTTFWLIAPGAARAQQPAAPAAEAAAPPAARAVQAVRIEVVLSRLEGEKRISNMPFTFLTTTGGTANLRIGSMVPIPQGTGQGSSITYQNVGTNIDVNVEPVTNGQYRLFVTFDDSSVADGRGTPVTSAGPVIRSSGCASRTRSSRAAW